MNTLSKTVTGVVLSETSYQTLREHWARLVNTHSSKLDPEHHLLYLALLGRDWRRAFSPITNSTTLANGGFFNWRFWPAMNALHDARAEERLLAPFADLVSIEALHAVRSLLPDQKSAYQYEDISVFQPGKWPLDAYRDPNPGVEREPVHAG